MSEKEIRDFIANWMVAHWRRFDVPSEASAEELLEEIARQSDDMGAENYALSSYE